MAAILERPSLFDAPIDPAVAQRALAASAVARRRAGGETSSVGGRVAPGPTLEASVSGVWEALAAHRTGPCLVCGGRMAPRYGASGRPVGGRCGDCGSTLG